MSAWILFACAAAFVQALRFMLQKQLSMGALSATGATFARFAYSVPLVWLGVLAYVGLGSASFPVIPVQFWPYALIGGVAQILATICVVALFKRRNFAVGITFKKTEVIQTALVGFIVLTEGVTAPALVAIAIGFAGVVILSDPPDLTEGRYLRRIWNRAAGLGLLSGLLFGISATCYRGASLSLNVDDTLLRTGVTLAMVTTFQSLIMVAWMQLRERGQVAAVFGAWRRAVSVGITSMIGSFCWFAAFSLQNAAYVKAVGQIELIFSFVIGVLVFREKTSLRELLAMALIAVSILVLVIAV